jgi:Flp pilus assembly pilin Flp
MTIFNLLDFVRMSWKKEEGQTMAEYGVVLAVITVLIVGVLATLSTSIQGQLQSVIDVL